MEHTSEYYRTKALNILVNGLAALFFLCCLAYAGYSLWDNWHVLSAADSIRDDLVAYRPTNEENLSYSFQELMALNPDVCAWLTVDHTDIDYPVVQGKDNVRYVNTDVYVNFSLSGSIFLDFRNARDFSDTYSLIYGHHMDGQVMFGELDAFIQQDYFAEHTGGILYLPANTCQIEWFACLKTDAYDPQIFSPGNLSGPEQNALLTHIRETALQYRDIGVTSEDRILSLSTCSDTSTNARIILVGRLSE